MYLNKIAPFSFSLVQEKGRLACRQAGDEVIRASQTRDYLRYLTIFRRPTISTRLDAH